MDSISNMNRVIEYIEAHLDSEIVFSEIERIAICSEYHFRKMFSFLSGISLTEYIRRRRLTLAALELSESDTRVLDVAIKYGYTSNDAFSRAFYAMHGVLPSEVRKSSAAIRAFPKMTFRLTIEGGNEMKCRLIEKEAFYIIGFKKRVPIVFSGVNPDIQEMYKNFTPDIIGELKSFSDMEPAGIISASTNFSDGRMEEKGELDHYIGVASTQEHGVKYELLKVDACSWAVFEVVGPFPETLQATWGRIYSEWFPMSGYESVEGPEILWHESKDTSDPNYRSEIWIPVKRK